MKVFSSLSYMSLLNNLCVCKLTTFTNLMAQSGNLYNKCLKIFGKNITNSILSNSIGKVFTGGSSI